jgi:hypothetical protein
MNVEAMHMTEHAAMTGLDSLAGEQLSGVAFVQDYVEFHYDGKILRSLTPPCVTLAGSKVTFPQRGSRDAFCSLIGRAVQEVRLKENDSIEIVFGESAAITIPLNPGARTGPEAAHFVPGENQPMEVW